MMAEQRQDRSALRWIRGELDQTLRDARISLEEFVDGQQNQLLTCVDRLHQVHGVLEMVQIYGGAMLADEMEELAVALSQGQAKNADSAAEALMLGMVQLPAYLQKLESGSADVPLALLPLINDLRAAHDAPLVSEASLFAPKLNAVIAAETVRPGSGNRELPRLISAQRVVYHRALLNWIRGNDETGSIRHLRDVLDLLNNHAGTARLRRLLDAAQALTTVLLEDADAPATEVRPLFGKLDRVFKAIMDQGEEVAMLDFPVDLLKGYLYYVVRSTSSDPVVNAVRQTADLANGFPDPATETVSLGALGAPDREMFEAVAEALSQDLRNVKDQLDLYIRSDRSGLDRLVGLAQPIQRIGDTLGMVGRGELRTRLKRRCDELREAGQAAAPPPDEQLMGLAGDLLFVESALANLAAGVDQAADPNAPMEGGHSQSLSEGEMQQHMRAAVDEAKLELAKTKEAFLEYLNQPTDTGLLAEVPSRLHHVAGVMSMLGLSEAGKLLSELKPYVEALAQGGEEVPDLALRDAVADVITGAELYMHSVIEPGGDRQKLLAVGDAALRKLGMRGSTDSVQAGASVIEFQPAATPAEDEGAAADEPEAVMQPSPEPDVPVAAEVPAPGPDAAPADVPTEAPPPAGDAVEAEVEVPAPGIDEEIDSEILEVFAEEADEELQVIQECFPAWRADPQAQETLVTMRRSFHTLKGSGRIVGALNLGEFAWSIENLLNRVIDGTVAASAELMQLIEEVVGVLPTLVEESRQPGAAGTDVSALSERAFALASGEQVAAAAGEGIDATAVTEADEAGAADMPAAIEKGEPDAQTVPTVVASAAQAAVGETAEKPSGSPERRDDNALEQRTASDLEAIADESILTDAEAADSDFTDLDIRTADESADSSLSAVFVSEARSHLQTLDGFVQHCREQTGTCHFDDAVRRAMHTLRGSARTADEHALAELAEALERLGNVLSDARREVGADTVSLLERSHETLSELVDAVEEPDAAVDSWQALRDEVERHCHTLLHPPAAEATGDHVAADEAPVVNEIVDPELLEIFLDEAKELLESLDGELGDWQGAAADDRTPVTRLQRTLHTMKGGARLAGVLTVGDLSHALESVFESVAEQRVGSSGRLKQLVRIATDALAQDVELLIRGGMPVAHPALIARLESAAHGREWQDVGADEVIIGSAAESPSSLLEPSSLLSDEVTPLEAESPSVQAAPEAEPVAGMQAEDELAPEPEPEPEPVPESEAEPEVQTEPGVFPVAESVSAAADAAEIDGIEAELAADEDEFGVDSELLTDSQLMTDSELLGDSSFLISAPSIPSEQGAVGEIMREDSKVIQFPGVGQSLEGEGFVPRRPPPEQEPAPAAGTERVRVAAEVLDQMVNNAGEVSIYRARLEQQNSSVAFNLGELGQTIDRLRGQLRHLELETEAQILSRHERESESRADFDPLELDRYSTMQQLSRALSETVEDLSNLGQSLIDLSRDSDTLLLQQSRVTTDLQDSLLRTRMVKFSSRVPRLERVVRQTSHSVGKQANLDVVGGEEDMDRAILERMMSPLEHLLRNAVSHGIEDANTRLAAGKPAEGLITLHLAREGSDVILTLSDDGAGLDRARIRAKAVERGLIEGPTAIEDNDLYQLILQPGFSTAQALSQVSGRGVGMDVVLTEVKQLGGTLEIDSQPGRGTSFTIRLPFTLAITDSLLVTLGEDMYAIPHSSMDGVVRISLDELRAIYAGEQDSFRYADREYVVRYLGSMLGTQAPHVSEGAKWLPLLLVRSGEHRVAIHVDGLLGNRQIVVKSVGAQLSTVPWFTGGTILADGQIALILDVNSLVRFDSAQQQPAAPLSAEVPASQGVSVMVVDDSITVRKVTSRLLERHNMHVITAKDGVDAVTILQEQQPDVMLLDIEMPRMDGYELARHMRSTPELSNIPIIMITSRTGDKHRSRALELGVKRYLGKPYQEADLLENIYTVLAEASS